MMRRREVLALLGGAAAAWPLEARAQQPALPVIGFLGSASPDLFTSQVRAFGQGLREVGFVEGQSVTIEYRWAYGRYDLLPQLAADLVRRPVTVIVTSGGVPSAKAAKQATTTIPIVFVLGGDPVHEGLVASLNRPGGNLTGITSMNSAVAPKRVEMLHELVPTATEIALLFNPTGSAAEAGSRELLAAAQLRGLKPHVLHASSEDDLITAFASLLRMRAGGLVIGTDAFFISRSEQLAALSIRHTVPAAFQFRSFAAAGGLMSYGSSFTDTYRQAALQVGRILRGQRPADLPVHQATKVELILNLRTAKALGITVPLSLLGRADEVIE